MLELSPGNESIGEASNPGPPEGAAATKRVRVEKFLLEGLNLNDMLAKVDSLMSDSLALAVLPPRAAEALRGVTSETLGRTRGGPKLWADGEKTKGKAKANAKVRATQTREHSHEKSSLRMTILVVSCLPASRH